MNLTDLEEAADLKPQDVREYLERKGWRKVSQLAWEGPGGVMLEPDDLGEFVGRIALEEGRSVQALLREICKRWAPFPSAAAIQAHEEGDGLWFMKHPKLGIRSVALSEDEAHCGCQSISKEELIQYGALFWPHDGEGNKVPMYRDAEGKEL